MNALAQRRSPPFWRSLRLTDGRLRFVCDLRSGHAREVCFMGYLEPQETVVLCSLLRPGHCFVDLGANWGYFTLLAADRVGPSGKVVACEPHPVLLDLLRANVRLNGLSQVDVYGEAVADVEGEMDLAGFDLATSNWGVSRLQHANGDGSVPTYRVPTVRLQSLLYRSRIEQVDLLKIDIEGAEAFVLPGLGDAFAHHQIKAVLLELHPTNISGGEAGAKGLLEPILAAGYRGWLVDHSPAAFRRAAYRLPASAAEFLAPLDLAQPLGDWPHVVLLAPKVEPAW